MDGGQIGDALEYPAADLVFGDQAEEAIDLVEPGRGGWREMRVKSLVAL